MTVDSDLDTTIMTAEVRPLALPTGMKPITLPNGHRPPTDLSILLLRLTDEDGLLGWSTLWATHPNQLPLFEAGLRFQVGQVEGRRLDQSPSISFSLYQAMSFVGRQGVAAFAASAFEMAIEDLICRRRNISLGRALGQVSNRVRAYQTGLMPSADADELVSEAQAIYANGIRAVKMVLGRPRLEEDLERVALVRATLPADTRLMVDALQKWSYPDALRAARALAEFDLVWLEDPLDYTDIVGYRDLVRTSPVPIATGESLFAVESFQQLLDARVPYIVGELERVGGIRPWVQIAALAQASSATMLPHIFPYVSAQLVSTLRQKEIWWEYVPWFNGLLDYDFDINDGYLTVADRPGSGLDPSPDAVEDFATGPWRRITIA
jgi:L-alanine-DL-glutamate epimerase-like enolase superfamily enzyme